MGRLGDQQKVDIQTARDLLYPESVIRKLKHEEDPYKRSRILTNARKEEMKKEEKHHGTVNRKRSTNKKNKRSNG